MRQTRSRDRVVKSKYVAYTGNVEAAITTLGSSTTMLRRMRPIIRLACCMNNTMKVKSAVESMGTRN